MSGENLFLALMLDPALHETVAGRIRASVRKHQFTGRSVVAAERLHISLLNFTGDDEAKVRAIAATVRFPPIKITLDRAMTFRIPGKDRPPFVLSGGQGLEGVREFHHVLYDWFFGDDPGAGKAPSFTPHMTLLYDAKIVPPYGLEHPLSWTAGNFALVRSHVGKGRYDIVGRWPLGD